MTDDIQELRRQNMRLAGCLKQHHQWQLGAEGLFMFYKNPETKRLECCDISGEYADCDLHDISRRALIFQADIEAKYRIDGGSEGQGETPPRGNVMTPPSS